METALFESNLRLTTGGYELMDKIAALAPAISFTTNQANHEPTEYGTWVLSELPYFCIISITHRFLGDTEVRLIGNSSNSVNYFAGILGVSLVGDLRELGPKNILRIANPMPSR